MFMFFGLTNSPATFQHMMDTIFADLKEKHALLGTSIQVYMDDIMIASSSGLAGHHAVVHDVLDFLATHNLFLKPEKCKWETDSINYLGVILEKGVTHMDPTKVSSIREFFFFFFFWMNLYCGAVNEVQSHTVYPEPIHSVRKTNLITFPTHAPPEPIFPGDVLSRHSQDDRTPKPVADGGPSGISVVRKKRSESKWDRRVIRNNIINDKGGGVNGATRWGALTKGHAPITDPVRLP
jgi:hypothetical protein